MTFSGVQGYNRWCDRGCGENVPRCTQQFTASRYTEGGGDSQKLQVIAFPNEACTIVCVLMMTSAWMGQEYLENGSCTQVFETHMFKFED